MSGTKLGWSEAVAMYGGGSSPVMFCDFETFKKWNPDRIPKIKGKIAPPILFYIACDPESEIAKILHLPNDPAFVFYDLDSAVQALRLFAAAAEKIGGQVLWSHPNCAYLNISTLQWLEIMLREGGRYIGTGDNNFYVSGRFENTKGTAYDVLCGRQGEADLGFGTMFISQLIPESSFFVNQAADQIIFLRHFYPKPMEAIDEKEIKDYFGNKKNFQRCHFEEIGKKVEEKVWKEEYEGELNIETYLVAALGVVSPKNCVDPASNTNIKKLKKKDFVKPIYFQSSDDGWGDYAGIILPETKGLYKVYTGKEHDETSEFMDWSWVLFIKQ